MSRKGRGNHFHRKTWNVAAAILLAGTPVFCAWVYCLLKRQYFSNIYLPSSPWNDELFYYKMTENVLAHGYPQGYFGFNESHGQYLSFAAWSPMLLFFWVVWGFFFGWNLLSPMLCNLTLLSISMLLFAVLTKPDKRQALSIMFLYGTFIPISRFALSCIPEAELFALLIVFLGLAASCRKNYRGWMIGAMFALVMAMTWMRPYLILLFLTPTALLFDRKGKQAFGWTGILAAVTIIIYVAINRFLGAPYLEDLFYTEWIKAYFEQGIPAGLRYTVWKLWTSLGAVWSLIRANLTAKSGLISAAGLYYLIFLLLLALLLARAAWRLLHKDWGGFLPEGQMLLGMAGFFAADLLMYRIQEGGRHALIYIAGCLFLLPFVDIGRKRELYMPIGLSVFLALLFLARGNVPYEFAVPYAAEDRKADLENLATQLAEEMELIGDAPNYDNTVIWVFSDEISGKRETVDFGAYYAVPTGFGINLCSADYLDANLEALKSRYVGVIPGGTFEKRCIAAGGRAIGKCKTLVVYAMR